MKLVKKIGNITLSQPLEWTNYETVQTVIAEEVGTIDGGAVIYELAAQNSAMKIELSSSGNGGLQTAAIKDSIMTLARTSMGATTTITTYENEVINVRFRYEDGAADAEGVVKARLSSHYRVNIKLRRV